MSWVLSTSWPKRPSAPTFFFISETEDICRVDNLSSTNGGGGEGVTERVRVGIENRVTRS